MVVTHHGKLVYPHDCPEALDLPGLLVGNEVSDKEAFANRLRVLIMAFGRAGGCPTGGTEGCCLVSDELVTAWTLQLL